MSQPSPAPASAYLGQRVALLTRHDKQTVLAEVLDNALGCQLEHVTGYDTDLLGTFTRDVARVGSQLEAARAKARIGMELSGLPVGLASEGSFGPDPVAFMLPHNLELLVWIDDLLGIEVVATCAGPTNFAHGTVSSWEEARPFAEAAGFPGHRLIVRPDGGHHPQFQKGLADWDSLRRALEWALAVSDSRQAFMETDMRAFANPTRMANIRRAGQALAYKLASRCPACGAPGFAKAAVVEGLPCEDCGLPTTQARADLYRCVRCPHEMTVERGQRFAKAAHCGFCNP